MIKFKTNPPKSWENRVNYQTSNKLKLFEIVENRWIYYLKSLALLKFLNLLVISRKIMTLNQLTLISFQRSSSSKDVEDKKQFTKL